MLRSVYTGKTVHDRDGIDGKMNELRQKYIVEESSLYTAVVKKHDEFWTPISQGRKMKRRKEQQDGRQQEKQQDKRQQERQRRKLKRHPRVILLIIWGYHEFIRSFP